MNLNDIINVKYASIRNSSGSNMTIIDIPQKDFFRAILLPDLYNILIDCKAHLFRVCIPEKFKDCTIFIGYTPGDSRDIYIKQTETGYTVDIDPPHEL